MTRIDFYILSDNHNRLDFMCRLTEKLYRDGQRLHIHAANDNMADRIDGLLWSYRDISFIPHELSVNAPETAVTIGHSDTAPGCNTILINLADEIPQFFSHFERVVEIVDSVDSQRQSGRVRYKYYRDRGYELTNHTIE